MHSIRIKNNIKSKRVMEEKTKNVEELRREFFTSKKEFVEKANDCVALAKSYLNTLLEG